MLGMLDSHMYKEGSLLPFLYLCICATLGYGSEANVVIIAEKI